MKKKTEDFTKFTLKQLRELRLVPDVRFSKIITKEIDNRKRN